MYVQQFYSPEAAYARYNNKIGVPHVLSVVHDPLYQHYHSKNLGGQQTYVLKPSPNISINQSIIFRVHRTDRY